MKYIWQFFVKIYLQIGLFFFYKKILVYGKENIPKGKAVFFVGNHQNSVIDSLLACTTNDIKTYVLSSAHIFKNPIYNFLLSSINMLPIYRIRDGFETLTNNEAIFKHCFDLLDEKKALLIYPEGNHNLQRRVRVIGKGFTRIVFGAIERNPDNEIDIIPFGLNYNNPTAYASKASLYFGKPISANEYYNNFDKNNSIKEIKAEVSKQLKLLTTHIEDIEKHDEIVKFFDKDEFLDPIKANEKLNNLDNLSPINPSQNKGFNPLLLLVKINSFFPLLIWNHFKPTIKEKEYIATIKIVLGITVFPIFYFIQKSIITYFFGNTVGWIYIILSFLMVLILTKTKK